MLPLKYFEAYKKLGQNPIGLSVFAGTRKPGPNWPFCVWNGEFDEKE